MPLTYLKTATPQPQEALNDIADTVQLMLGRIKSGARRWRLNMPASSMVGAARSP